MSESQAKSLIGKIERKADELQAVAQAENEAAQSSWQTMTDTFRTVAGGDDKVFAQFCKTANLPAEFVPPHDEDQNWVELACAALGDEFSVELYEQALAIAVSDRKRAEILEADLLASETGQRWIDATVELRKAFNAMWTEVFGMSTPYRYAVDLGGMVDGKVKPPKINLGVKITRQSSGGSDADSPSDYVKVGKYEGSAQWSQFVLKADEAGQLILTATGKANHGNGKPYTITETGKNGETSVNSLRLAVFSKLVDYGNATSASNKSVNQLFPDLQTYSAKAFDPTQTKVVAESEAAK